MAKAKDFKSVLIANRGEIACRVMRTAKRMGLRTIAVYSEADAKAPHVEQADEAVFIGPAPASESYLNIDRILKAARETGAEAIHPGYGFLSENADFARACAKAGLVFIGPPPDAIEIMGDKAKAKRRMIEAGVPCVPGYQGEDQSDAALLSAAKEIGFPVMVKAAAGGGGRGMRLVEAEKDLAAALKTARSEAENAFGAGDLILERAIVEPRHVEIQVFADAHGNVIHLGERDCSVQRRHQKVIEEAPSPAVTPDLRAAMGAAAIEAANDVGYIGAGTVEFLLDQDGAFYFLEMNTRLQVEHPVTEMITGLDLVEWQIRIARGETLPLKQDEVSLNGWAMEARLYAEDASKEFLPAAGRIDFWRPAPNARTDAGVATGGEVSAFYDPMLAKVIAHGATRKDARQKLVDALKETAVFGVTTNKKFLIDALEKDAFVKGQATTGFIAQSFSADELARPALDEETAACAAVLMFTAAQGASLTNAVAVSPPLLNWSSATPLATPYRLQSGEPYVDLTVSPEAARRYRVDVDGKSISVELLEFAEHDGLLNFNGDHVPVIFNFPDGNARLQMSIDGRDYDIVNLNAAFSSAQDAASAGAVAAPMHGMLVELLVKEGQRVLKGDRLAVLEAMKMQHELVATISGKVAAVHAAPNQQVAANAVLIEIEADDAKS